MLKTTPTSLDLECRVEVKRMSSISQLNCDAFIRGRIEYGFTHDAIAVELQQLYPGLVGLSSRSVRRYCSSNDIRYSSRLSA